MNKRDYTIAIKKYCEETNDIELLELIHLLLIKEAMGQTSEECSKESVYDKNGTMKMLGKQYYSVFTAEMLKQIHDIEEARVDEFTTNAAYDLFMLGYVHGKRAERSRR